MSENFQPMGNFSCPVSPLESPNILLSHGGGGAMTARLFEKVFFPAFQNSELEARHDGALLKIGSGRIAFTTDSFVVRPIFFPGGDIGKLAIYGTVNDLAMCGAVPLFLSAGFILEEGFPIDTLKKIVESMKLAAETAGVRIVTGDTKVVDKGKGDGIYINTAGVGEIKHSMKICPTALKPGDVVLLSGDIGRHGMAVMAVREGLDFEIPIESDCAPLAESVLALIDGGVEIHCLRDLTRGGLSAALVEIAQTSETEICIDEKEILVQENVMGACEILGIDPMQVANEGRFIAFIPETETEKALKILHERLAGSPPKIIGRVENRHPRQVTMTTRIGTHRIVDMPTGEPLPRIC